MITSFEPTAAHCRRLAQIETEKTAHSNKQKVYTSQWSYRSRVETKGKNQKELQLMQRLRQRLDRPSSPRPEEAPKGGQRETNVQESGTKRGGSRASIYPTCYSAECSGNGGFNASQPSEQQNYFFI